jgi:exosortase/archaeosortase family protein
VIAMTTGPVTIPTAALWWRPRAALTLASAPASGAQVIACRPSYLSPLGWLALQALALWPHGAWMARRVGDGSDDPLGLAALAVLAGLAWRWAARLRVAPHTGWLAAAGGLTAIANVALFALPPLACALVAAAALAAGLMAWAPPALPRAPVAGLLLLALPLVASLQYYGGYPLRLLTAQLSAALLQIAGIAAAPNGAAMTVGGQLVIVDAPCSGVQMAWMAYFCACTCAAATGQRDATFLLRLPWVGALVLAGNVLRNSVLVALEARPQGLDPGLHAAIGAVALAAVCAGVVALMQGGRDARLA